MTQNNGYRGNQYLKRAGVQIDWTPELIEEYKKCAEDPIHFISNYCKIVTLDDGLQLFKPFEYQKRMVKAFEDGRFVINLLPRQMGKSTIVAAYILWYSCFNSDKYVGLLANKAAVAREILSRIQRMYENLPFWLQPGLTEWNKGSMSLDNGTVVMAAATSSDSIRGFSLNLVYLDEFAHVDGQVEFWESTYPVVSSGSSSKVIITSTPNGMDLFYKIFTEAEKKENNFTAIKVHWSEHPKRDEAWKEETLRNIGHEQFRQEFDVEFMGSSGTLIDGHTLATLTHQTPIHHNQGLSVYQEAVPGRTYVCLVDVSRGKGLDYSACQVIDVTEMPYKQVCTYRNNLTPPVEFVQLLFGVLKKYNEALVLIEVNDIGGQVADLLHYDYEYENIIKTQPGGSAGKRISMSGKGDRGVRTTKTVKNVGCSILKLLVEQKQLILNDFETINELSTFSAKGTSYEAEPGCHDDLAMCLVLFAWLSNQKYFKELTDINTLAKLRERTEEEIEQWMTPFGVRYDAAEEMEIDDDPFPTYGESWLL